MNHGGHHQRDELPTSGRELTGVAVSATLHCLTGCAIGEILGMAIGTATGIGDWPTVALSVTLAFYFALSVHQPAASARRLRARGCDSDRARLRHVLDPRSWRSWTTPSCCSFPARWRKASARCCSGARWLSRCRLLVAALPFNRWLIARGKGHAAVHRTGVHGGPNTRVVGTVLLVAFVFGTSVLAAEVMAGSDDGETHHETALPATSSARHA